MISRRITSTLASRGARLFPGSLAFALMEFDWIDCHFDLKKVTPGEIEEAFEDPFSVRLLPEFASGEKDTRFFALGKTLASRYLFSVFWTDGKRYRVILSRDMTDEEQGFYERKNAEWL